MAKRPKRPLPVRVPELHAAILRMMVSEFAGRELTIETARLALAQVAYDLTFEHLREVAKRSERERRERMQ